MTSVLYSTYCGTSYSSCSARCGCRCVLLITLPSSRPQVSSMAQLKPKLPASHGLRAKYRPLGFYPYPHIHPHPSSPLPSLLPFPLLSPHLPSPFRYPRLYPLLYPTLPSPLPSPRLPSPSLLSPPAPPRHSRLPPCTLPSTPLTFPIASPELVLTLLSPPRAPKTLVLPPSTNRTQVATCPGSQSTHLSTPLALPVDGWKRR